MPTKLRRLKEQAIESCTKRLHKMDNFINFQRYSTSYCKCCHMYVQVIPKPYPNEIDIGGDAVALNCSQVPYRDICKQSNKNPVIS